MMSEKNPNASDSGTMSTSAQNQPQSDDPKAHDAHPALSEADFLAQQQAQARTAISNTLADMKHAVAQSVNLREWTREHPWILMGTAAVAGAVAAALLTPSKEETFKEFFEEKWEKFKEK